MLSVQVEVEIRSGRARRFVWRPACEIRFSLGKCFDKGSCTALQLHDRRMLWVHPGNVSECRRGKRQEACWMFLAGEISCLGLKSVETLQDLIPGDHSLSTPGLVTELFDIGRVFVEKGLTPKTPSRTTGIEFLSHNISDSRLVTAKMKNSHASGSLSPLLGDYLETS